MSSQASKKDGKKSLAGRSVHVIGQNRFENELLAFYLKREIGVQCDVRRGFFRINTKDIETSDMAALSLVECSHKDIESFLSEIERYESEIPSRHFVALYNVEKGRGIEEKAVAQGIKGIFYREDPIKHFKKGIGAIFEGELWVSREILTKCVMGNRAKDTSKNQDEALLTLREMEILAMVSMGIKNEEIADKLCISPNTVKTHIYNIFKKIGVPNRLQAALWAAKNL